MKSGKKTLMFLLILFAMTFALMGNDEVSAKVRFNRTSKTIIKGKSYTVKISGVKLKKIKKVKLKYNKKILKVRKVKKNTYKIVGKKKGNTTLKATIRYRRLDNSVGRKNLKCKFKIKKQAIQSDTENAGSNEDNNNSYDNYYEMSSNSVDDVISYLNKTESGLYNLKKVNNYLIENTAKNADFRYRIIVNPFYRDGQWYSEEEYKEIVNEAERIIKEAGVTSDMTDQEKAWRIGRTIIYNIDYVAGTNIYRIHDALFKKQTVCAGYANTYSFLCRYIGLDCDYVDGDGHAWNIVRLGEYYYRVDLTNAYFVQCAGVPGVVEFFMLDPYDPKMEEAEECYRTEEYKKTHPLDTVDYYTRCEMEGVSCLSQKELLELFN